MLLFLFRVKDHNWNSAVTAPSPVKQPLTTSSDETEIITSVVESTVTTPSDSISNSRAENGTGSSVRTYPTRHRVPPDRYRPGTLTDQSDNFACMCLC